jgi:DNA invertase Pin-like site-specific DNA recombinase
VLHKCDVRRCLNPEHLFLGSHVDNHRDAARKGRVKVPPLGILHNRARLDPDKVREIRTLARSGVPKAKIARQFGVWPRAIWMILEGKSWKHVI